MEAEWSLKRPHPEHQPEVLVCVRGGRHGTALRCSCSSRTTRVSWSLPSRGGLADAEAHYRAHVAGELERLDGPEPGSSPPCL